MQFGKANSLNAKKTLQVDNKKYSIFSLQIAAEALNIDLGKLPNTLKILLEILLRFEDGKTVKSQDIKAMAGWLKSKSSEKEISFYPARVLMQDFTGVPAIVDLASMRNAALILNKDPKKINPLIPVDLIIDHSVQVDKYATNDAYAENVKFEMGRNKERYELLKWGQKSFNNFKVVPPGTGICHQVNLEYIAKVIWTKEQQGEVFAYPDTLVGTDSHTTMVNGLSVLGWGVGGIEAEAAMLGQPMGMVIPEVVGFKIIGKLKEGVTATDLVLTVTNLLRLKGVVNKFVEFYGEGLKYLPLADRATVANMAPEYGATCGFFPTDEETIKYLHLTGKSREQIELIKAYTKEQKLWRDDNLEMEFSDRIELDLSQIEPSIAGPRRPQDKVALKSANDNFLLSLLQLNKNPNNVGKEFEVQGRNFKLKNGDVVIAAITSCTNTSNPFVMIGAGLLARKALARGLNVKPWVKTSLAPGSKVVSAYLEHSGLQNDLDKLGFNLVGYGCTTCIGNSGPLLPEIENTIIEDNLVVAAVLSGNRNFEARIHPLVRANYLASPMLCVAYALAGTMSLNLSSDPIGKDKNNKDVYLKDIWPSTVEVQEIINNIITPEMFKEKYSDLFQGTEEWQELKVNEGIKYEWKDDSTYIKLPPYFDSAQESKSVDDIKGARILAIFGDSITTDHISPAGSISPQSPAAKYLNEKGIEHRDFNSYGARRGNHEVMMRGTFANVRIRNEMLQGVEGGYTKFCGAGDNISIYDAAMKYKAQSIPTIIFAGKEYGTGSSRDWAAKGTNLLGVKAVIAESFERIHRSNLVGMGVIPLVFKNGMTRRDLGLLGDEEINIQGLLPLVPHKNIKCQIIKVGKVLREFDLLCRIDTEVEVEYMQHGSILHCVLHKLYE